MPRPRQSAPPAVGRPRPRTWGEQLKRWTIPIIGGVTPVGLIVVNIAAFVVKHLAEFRWTISILALVSGLMLNTWTAINIYRFVQRRRPQWRVAQPHNQEMVLMGGMAVVIGFSFLTALFCYRGLDDPNDLPNALTFVTGAVAIATPILLQAFFRRAVPPQPLIGSGGAAVPKPGRGNEGAAGGYQPPGYLPPS